MRQRNLRYLIIFLVMTAFFPLMGTHIPAIAAEPPPLRPNESIIGLPASISGPNGGTQGQFLTYIIRTTNVTDTLVMNTTYGLLLLKLESNAPCTVDDGGTETSISCGATLYRITIKSDWGQRIRMKLPGILKDVVISGPYPVLDTRVYFHGADQNMLVGQTGKYQITVVNRSTEPLTYTMNLILLSGIPRNAVLQVTKNPLGCNVAIGVGFEVLSCAWAVPPDTIEQRDLEIKWTFPALHALHLVGTVNGDSVGHHTRYFGVVQVDPLPEQPYTGFIPVVSLA